jgi:hypothetical protein
MRARVGPIPMYAFNRNASEPYTTAWDHIARHHNVLFWRDVGQSIDQALYEGLMSWPLQTDMGTSKVMLSLLRSWQSFCQGPATWG